jgi:DNA-binding transcriptional MerR regulator
MKPMAKVSLSQAAEDTGVSLPTLSRWRKSGKITAEKTDNGYLMDTSEYDRIQELRKQSPSMKGGNKTVAKGIATPPETHNETSVLQVEVEFLRERIKDKDQIIEDKNKQIENAKVEKQDLSKKIDDLTGILNRQTYLLEKPQEDPVKHNDNQPQKPIEEGESERVGESSQNNEMGPRKQNFTVIGLSILLLAALGFIVFQYWDETGCNLNNLSPASCESR